MKEKILNAILDLQKSETKIDYVFSADDHIIHLHKCKENKPTAIQFATIDELNVKYLIILTKNNPGRTYFTIDLDMFWIEYTPQNNVVEWEENMKG